MADIPQDPDPTCSGNNNNLPVDPAKKTLSDRFWSSLRGESNRCIRTTQDTDVLVMPWGPRIDVSFDAKRAPNLQNGRVRIMARTAGAEVEIASTFITTIEKAMFLSASQGCDEYIVRVNAAANATSDQANIQSYFFARVYDAGQCSSNTNSGGGGGGPVIH